MKSESEIKLHLDFWKNKSIDNSFDAYFKGGVIEALTWCLDEKK